MIIAYCYERRTPFTDNLICSEWGSILLFFFQNLLKLPEECNHGYGRS